MLRDLGSRVKGLGLGCLDGFEVYVSVWAFGRLGLDGQGTPHYKVTLAALHPKH